MDVFFQKQVHLLLRILPEIAKENDFTLHGGTAINLFYHEMPRLSVDIDLTWIPYGERQSDLKQIREKLISVSLGIKKSIPAVQFKKSVNEDDELKLYCSLLGVIVKIEVNTISRGIIEEPVLKPLCISAQKLFNSYCEVQTVPFSQLYGGKIVAAMDRQHPRDLFDCFKLLETTGYTTEIHNGFLFCLLSSKRPLHEILNPHFIDQRHLFDNYFVGMTAEPFSYQMFEQVRYEILKLIRNSLNDEDKKLIKSFSEGKPEWKDRPWAEFPGIKWKLMNIRKLESTNPKKFQDQLQQLNGIFSL